MLGGGTGKNSLDDYDPQEYNNRQKLCMNVVHSSFKSAQAHNNCKITVYFDANRGYAVCVYVRHKRWK